MKQHVKIRQPKEGLMRNFLTDRVRAPAENIGQETEDRL